MIEKYTQVHTYVIQNIQINSFPSKVYSHNSTHATVSTELFKLYYFVSFSFLHSFLNTVLFWPDYSRLFPTFVIMSQSSAFADLDEEKEKSV